MCALIMEAVGNDQSRFHENHFQMSAATGLAGTETRLTAVLLNEDGERLAQGRLVRLTTHGGCGCGGDHDHDAEAGP